jgi:hypothetical protein
MWARDHNQCRTESKMLVYVLGLKYMMPKKELYNDIPNITV